VNGDLLWEISVWVIPVILAITLHEASHGFVAHLFGDDTAWNSGRVSANPLRHVDPFGTILLPGMLLLAHSPFLFGYAKPVPVNFWALRNPKRDMIWVAAAGPVTNILMALCAGFLIHLLPLFPGLTADWLMANLVHAIEINVILAVFNMIPLPPLDGGRVAVGLLPRALAIPLARTERYGILILLGLLILVPLVGQQFGYDLDPVADIIERPVKFMLGLIASVTGLD
jgi:Zn-dependent protease